MCSEPNLTYSIVVLYGVIEWSRYIGVLVCSVFCFVCFMGLQVGVGGVYWKKIWNKLQIVRKRGGWVSNVATKLFSPYVPNFFLTFTGLDKMHRNRF